MGTTEGLKKVKGVIKRPKTTHMDGQLWAGDTVCPWFSPQLWVRRSLPVQGQACADLPDSQSILLRPVT